MVELCLGLAEVWRSHGLHMAIEGYGLALFHWLCADALGGIAIWVEAHWLSLNHLLLRRVIHRGGLRAELLLALGLSLCCDEGLIN